MLQIIVWDVQHGSAAYVKTPGGKHIVIDLGTGSYIGEGSNFSPLLHLKNNYGITSLDEVIITHPHTDHIDDILNFDYLSPKVLYRPRHLCDEDIIKANPSSDKIKVDKYIEINNRYNETLSNAEDPSLSENNGGVMIHSFTPYNCGRSNINNHSVVNVIEYLGIKVIIPGDNETPSWKELIERKDFTDAIEGANIFVASHHGRESGYYSELFNYFKPDLVVISDGAATETSITEKYSKVAKGWVVYRQKDGSAKERKCLTTRTDGSVVIKIGLDNGRKFMNITVD